MKPYDYGRKHGRYVGFPVDWAKCGTEANYRAHMRRGEAPCDRCRRATNELRRQRRARVTS